VHSSGTGRDSFTRILDNEVDRPYPSGGLGGRVQLLYVPRSHMVETGLTGRAGTPAYCGPGADILLRRPLHFSTGVTIWLSLGP